jgi:hypothetical protein
MPPPLTKKEQRSETVNFSLTLQVEQVIAQKSWVRSMKKKKKRMDFEVIS